MKHLVLIIAFSLLSFSAVAQNSYNNLTATTPPESGRYEIITSSIAMRETYLLDKDTGDTWQLVSSYYGYSWQKLRKQGILPTQSQQDTRGVSTKLPCLA